MVKLRILSFQLLIVSYMNTKYIALLFYDIPNSTKEQSYKYTKFRKYILSIGFVMLQQSVYVKSINSKHKYQLIKRDLTLASPSESNVRSLLITESVYNNLDLINGEQSFKEQIISKKIRVLEL